MKKRLLIVMLISLFVLTGCGCLHEISERANKERDEKENTLLEKVMPNVKTYIMNKYGFELLDSDIDEVLYSCNNSSLIGCDGLSGEVDIKAHYQGKSYKIRANDDSIERFSDTYESDVLHDIVKRYISNYFGINYNSFEVFLEVSSFDGTEFDWDFFYHDRLNVANNSINDLIYRNVNFSLITYNDINDNIKNKIKGIKNIITNTKTFHFIQTYDLNTYNEYINLYKSKETDHLRIYKEKNRLVKEDFSEYFN